MLSQLGVLYCLFFHIVNNTNPHKEVTTQKAPAIFAQGVTMQEWYKTQLGSDICIDCY